MIASTPEFSCCMRIYLLFIGWHLFSNKQIVVCEEITQHQQQSWLSVKYLWSHRIKCHESDVWKMNNKNWTKQLAVQLVLQTASIHFWVSLTIKKKVCNRKNWRNECVYRHWAVIWSQWEEKSQGGSREERNGMRNRCKKRKKNLYVEDLGALTSFDSTMLRIERWRQIHRNITDNNMDLELMCRCVSDCFFITSVCICVWNVALPWWAPLSSGPVRPPPPAASRPSSWSVGASAQPVRDVPAAACSSPPSSHKQEKRSLKYTNILERFEDLKIQFYLSESLFYSSLLMAEQRHLLVENQISDVTLWPVSSCQHRSRRVRTAAAHCWPALIVGASLTQQEDECPDDTSTQKQNLNQQRWKTVPNICHLFCPFCCV